MQLIVDHDSNNLGQVFIHKRDDVVDPYVNLFCLKEVVVIVVELPEPPSSQSCKRLPCR